MREEYDHLGSEYENRNLSDHEQRQFVIYSVIFSERHFNARLLDDIVDQLPTENISSETLFSLPLDSTTLITSIESLNSKTKKTRSSTAPYKILHYAPVHCTDGRIVQITGHLFQKDQTSIFFTAKYMTDPKKYDS